MTDYAMMDVAKSLRAISRWCGVVTLWLMLLTLKSCQIEGHLDTYVKSHIIPKESQPTVVEVEPRKGNPE